MNQQQSWQASAKCASRLDLPWLADSIDVTAWESATMRSVCADCPVLASCAAAVVELDVTGGWWAGTDRDPEALSPTAGVPVTWRALLTADGQPIGAQGVLDLGTSDGTVAA